MNWQPGPRGLPFDHSTKPRYRLPPTQSLRGLTMAGSHPRRLPSNCPVFFSFWISSTFLVTQIGATQFSGMKFRKTWHIIWNMAKGCQVSIICKYVNFLEIEKDSKNTDWDRRKPHAEPVFQVPPIKGSEPLPLGVRPQKEIWCRSFGQKNVIHAPYFRLKTYENCEF